MKKRMEKEMKKIIGLMLAALMTASCFAPGVAMAETADPSEESAGANAAAADPAKAPDTSDLFAKFKKAHPVHGNKPEIIENTAIVMFSGSAKMTKKSAKKALTTGSGAVADVEVKKLWNFENAGTGEESTAGDVKSTDAEAESTDDAVALVKSDSLSTKKLINRLKKNSSVKYAEPDYRIYMASISSDKYSDRQWSMQNDGTDGLVTPNVKYQWDTKGTSGSEDVVAVVDTGVDYTHEDLKDNMWENDFYPELKGNYGYDFINGDGDPMDDNGHGTHCAGIIGAKGDNGKGISGVNKNVKIMALKILNESGGATLSHEIAAYNYINKALDKGVKVRAINNSWGGGEYSDIFASLVDTVGEKGAITVLAAGNDGAEVLGDEEYPMNVNSGYQISVAATNEAGKIASFSNYGDKVDVAAPGTNILSSVCDPIYNPTLYDDEKQSRLSAAFNDYEDPSNTWAAPDADDLVLNGKKYDPATGRDIEVSVEEGGFQSGNKLSIKAKEMSSGDILCIPLPYEIDENMKNVPELSVLANASGPEEVSLLGGSIFGLMDLREDAKLSASTIAENLESGMYVTGESDTWDHFVNGLDPETVDLSKESNRKRKSVILLYTEVPGDYEINLDDVGRTKDDISDPAEFEKYDFYSGTSMATPYITGAVMLKTAELEKDLPAGQDKVNPEEVINSVVSLTKDSGLPVASGGCFDFKATPGVLPPRIGSISVDPKAQTITIKGSGFDVDGLKVEFRKSFSEEDWVTAEIVKKDKGSVVVKNNRFINNYEDIRITGKDDKYSVKVENYLVKGKKEYAESGSYDEEPVSGPTTIDGRYIYSASHSSGTVEQTDPKDPDNFRYVMRVNTDKVFKGITKDPKETYGMLFGKDLVYMNGAVYSMVEYGAIDYLESDEEFLIFSNNEYLEYEEEEEEEEAGDYTIYSGVTKLLAGNVNGSKCVDFGYLPSDLAKCEDVTMAAYNGKLYFIGGYSMAKGARGIVKTVKVFDPAKKKWSNGPALPGGRAGGRAFQSGNKLIYTLGYSDDTEVGSADAAYLPKNLVFNGKTWKESSEKLEPLVAPDVVTRDGKHYFNFDCLTGLAKGGLVYVGMPVCDYGDTFTYDAAKDKYADTGYNLNQTPYLVDVVSGYVLGNKINLFDEEGLPMTAKVASGLVKVSETKKGSGTVKGARDYVPGNDATIKVKAGKNSHIKSITAGGKKIKVKKGATAKTFKIAKLLSDKKVKVVFEKNKKVKVTVSKSGKGKVKGAGKYYVGTNVKIKVKAAKGYVIKSIKAGKKIAVKKKATKKNFTIKKIKKATKVKVVFAKK